MKKGMSDNMKSFLQFAKRVVKIINLLFVSNKKLYILSVSLSIIAGIIPIITAYIWKLLLDEIEQNSTNMIQMTVVWLVILGLVKLISDIFSEINIDIKSLQADYFNSYITDKLLDVINKSDLSCFDNSNYYNDYDMVCNQSLQKTIEIGSTISNIIVSFITLFSSFIILFGLNPVLLICTILLGMPALFAQTSISKKMFSIFENRIEDLRYTQFIKSFIIHYDNIKEIKVLSAGNYFKQRIISLYMKYISENECLIKEFNIKKSIVGFIQFIVSIIIQIFIMMLIFIKQHSVGNIIFYLQTYQTAESSISVIFTEFSKVYESDMYIKKLLEFLNQEKKNKSRIVKNDEFNQIKFCDVSFSYPGESRFALKDINITIEKGKSYAIVGRNGSGKSTFIKLLLNLYDEYAGNIFYNAYDLKKYAIKDYEKKFGVIFQDFTRYPLTVRENIGISEESQIDNISKIQDIAITSGADEFIVKLPKGYETNLYRQWTSGTDLSLGQWQKIGFSRAIYRDCQLLLMDEPTSALDAFSEKAIIDQAKMYCKENDITSILISHRLSNVKEVDEILVFDEGRIVEKGSHDDLIRRRGLYYQLYMTQAKSYRNKGVEDEN